MESAKLTGCLLLLTLETYTDHRMLSMDRCSRLEIKIIGRAVVRAMAAHTATPPTFAGPDMWHQHRVLQEAWIAQHSRITRAFRLSLHIPFR